MYLEPCCIAKDLPKLLKENTFRDKSGRTRNAVCFQSGGDWTVTDLLKAVTCLADKGILILAMPEVDENLLRTVSTYLSRDWCKELLLVTHEGQEQLVRESLAGHLEKVTYSVNKGLYEGFLGLFNGLKCVAVNGPMLLDKSFSICLYSAMYGDDPDIIYSATDAFRPLLRMNSVIKGGGTLTEEFLNHKTV